MRSRYVHRAALSRDDAFRICRDARILNDDPKILNVDESAVFILVSASLDMDDIDKEPMSKSIND